MVWLKRVDWPDLGLVFSRHVNAFGNYPGDPQGLSKFVIFHHMRAQGTDHRRLVRDQSVRFREEATQTAGPAGVVNACRTSTLSLAQDL